MEDHARSRLVDRSRRRHPARPAAQAHGRPLGDRAGQGRVPEPGRLGQGPGRHRDGARRGARRFAAAGRHHRRGLLGQHGHRAGAGGRGARPPHRRRAAGHRRAWRRSTCCAPTGPRWSRRPGTSRASTPSTSTTSRGGSPGETPGGWFANQYDNPANPEIHYATTGPEIWAATEGRVTHLVAGIGTGGTISGTGRFLKEKGGVEVVGADPATSRYGGGDGSPYFVEAAGHYRHTETVDDTWPLSYHQDVVDRIEAVDDRDSHADHPRLAQQEGLLVGASSGLGRRRRRCGWRAGSDPSTPWWRSCPTPGAPTCPSTTRRTGCAAWVPRRRPARTARRRRRRGADRHHVYTAGDEALSRCGGGQPIVPVVQPGRDPGAATAVSEILGALDPAVAADPRAPARPRASWPGRPRSRWARGRPRRRPSPGSTRRAQAARCCCATAASQAC